MRVLHLLVNHLSWLEIISSGLRKGIARSMAGCCALVQIKLSFYFLQRWNWTKTPTWHHSFQVQLNSAVSLITNFRSSCPLLPNHSAALSGSCLENSTLPLADGCKKHTSSTGPTVSTQLPLLSAWWRNGSWCLRSWKPMCWIATETLQLPIFWQPPPSGERTCQEYGSIFLQVAQPLLSPVLFRQADKMRSRE